MFGPSRIIALFIGCADFVGRVWFDCAAQVVLT